MSGRCTFLPKQTYAMGALILTKRLAKNRCFKIKSIQPNEVIPKTPLSVKASPNLLRLDNLHARRDLA